MVRMPIVAEFVVYATTAVLKEQKMVRESKEGQKRCATKAQL
jgi:hypothetical protein